MSLLDPHEQFNEIKSVVTESLKKIFPINKNNITIHVSKIYIEDNKDINDYKSQKETKSKGGTWSIPVYADVIMVDKLTGKETKDSKIHLMNLPKITDRGSYIVSGNEYQLSHQFRLRPGIYTTNTKSGDIKTQINLAKGGVGKNLTIDLDQNKLMLKARQANIPLYDLLRGLGTSHQEILKYWGKTATEAASEKFSDLKGEQAVKRFEKAFTDGSPALEFMKSKTKINPESTKSAIGKEFNSLTPELLALSAGKLINVKDGKEKIEDRDSLANKSIMGPADFFKEKIEKNNLSVVYNIQRNINKYTDIKKILSPLVFKSFSDKFFIESDKSSTTEQTNPLQMLSDASKITIMGEGGLQDSQQVTQEMRNVHSSHLGFIDPIHTPESDKIGATIHLPLLVKKNGDTINTPVFNLKTLQKEYLSPSDFYNKKIAFPDQFDSNGKALFNKIKISYKGEVLEVPQNEAQYRLVSPKQIFGLATNLIPFLQNNQGNRAMMAAKHMEQAVSLVHREEPLVQVHADQGASFESAIGSQFSIRSNCNGIVKEINNDKIIIQDDNTKKNVSYSIYNNFPLNQKTFLHHTPLIKVGDRVKKEQIIADTNYTKNGVLSLGMNLKTAYIPFKGYNYEDGIVISKSCAEKLVSEHMYHESIKMTPDIILDAGKFYSEFPTILSQENLNKLDLQGIIKKGERVKFDDVIIAALCINTISDGIASKIHKNLNKKYRQISEIWKHEDDGIVTDVHKSSNEIKVFIRTFEKGKMGDKLSLRHGSKGVITKIIDDHEMPHDKNGNPMEVLLNPHGIVGRINVGQLYESAAAKAAEKNKEKYLVENFSGKNYLNEIKKYVSDSKVNDKEELFDPETGKSLGKVHIGKPYVLKLFKQAEKGYSARGYGAKQNYSGSTLQGISGGDEGSKSMDLLTIYSLLSHNSREILKETSSIKGQKNDEYWEALKSGKSLPVPEVPHVFNKLITFMKGAGVDVKKDGNSLQLLPLTDTEVLKKSKLKITNPGFVMGKQLKEINGGFIDINHLGGVNGENWAHIELKERVINPIFENPIKALTGLKKTDLSQISKGEKILNIDGKELTGGEAIYSLLKKTDVKKELKKSIDELKKTKSKDVDSLNKKIKYLALLDKHEIRPEDAYCNKYIPVIPPKMRKLDVLPNGALMSPGVNYIYQGLGVLNKVSQNPVMDWLSDENKVKIRSEIQHMSDALRGLHDINVLKKESHGFIREISGTSQPKHGFFQSKVLKKQQDLVGRGVIMPEPSLGVDECAIPVEMGWKLYEPFIIKQLVSQGKNLQQAKEDVKHRTPLAHKILHDEMQHRPVLLNRSPSLHKFSIMAFRPKLTEGKSIKIPPMVTGPFNADFDGDTMTVHMPLSDKSIEEAHKMMPSNNLYKPGFGSLIIGPAHESTLGIYLLSQTEKDREKINKLLPEKFKIHSPLNKSKIKNLFMEMSKELPKDQFIDILQKIKTEGDIASYQKGFTLGLSDISIPENRDEMVKKVEEHVKKSGDFSSANKEFSKSVLEHLGKKNSGFYHMVVSGARGDDNQVRQIVAAPLYVKGANGQLITTPIKKSYAEGLDVAEYFNASYGARSGMIDRALQTSLPGAFSKDIMASTISNVVSTNDCGTHNGVELNINSRDCYDRYTAGDQYGIQHNTLVDTELLNKLKNQKINNIKVRSPLTCIAAHGTCKHCAGIDEFGKLPLIGENIGAKSGQTISEPLTQMTMRTFHSGGAAGTGLKKGGLDRITELLNMPKNLVNEAPIALQDGIVSKITPGVAGMTDVHINNDIYHIHKGFEPYVKIGQHVKKGELIGGGVQKPQTILKTKGMLAAQNYLVDELQNTYKDQGANVSRKILETVIRSVTNQTRIINPGHSSDFLKGDIAPLSVVNNFNSNLESTVEIEDGVGHVLNEDLSNFLKKGHLILISDIPIFKKLGKTTVKIKKHEIMHEPVLKGIQTIPTTTNDWLAQMGYREIAKSITQGASEGHKSNLRSYNPIPAYVHGLNFGEGTDGRY